MRPRRPGRQIPGDGRPADKHGHAKAKQRTEECDEAHAEHTQERPQFRVDLGFVYPSNRNKPAKHHANQRSVDDKLT